MPIFRMRNGNHMKKYGILFLIVMFANAVLAGCASKDDSAAEPLKPPANDSSVKKTVGTEPLKPTAD